MSSSTSLEIRDAVTGDSRDALTGQWLCTLAMVLVGSTVVASRLIGDSVEPFLATALRHAAALPVFLLLMRATRASWPRVGWRDGLLLLVQAAAGSVGYTVLLIEGVQRCGPADAGIVAGTLPAVSALVSVLFLGERPGWRLAAAIVLATAGVLVVAASPGSAGAAVPERWTGIALVLAAIGCEALFILANKRLTVEVPALALSTFVIANAIWESTALFAKKQRYSRIDGEECCRRRRHASDGADLRLRRAVPVLARPEATLGGLGSVGNQRPAQINSYWVDGSV